MQTASSSSLPPSNSRTMQTASSSSLPPSKTRNAAGPPHPQPPTKKPSRTPRKRGQPPPKEIERADDRKKCSTAFSKRHRTVLSKVNELSELPGAQAAVIMVSPAGNLHSSGIPSVEEVFFKYLSRKCRVEKTIHKYLCRHKGDVTPPMSQTEWEDWAEKECGSCPTRETIANLIMKHASVLNYLSKKFKDLEDNPSVKAGASDGSLKDCIRDADSDRLSISLVDSAVSSGSSGVESTRMFSDHEDCCIDDNNAFLNLDDDIEINKLWSWE